jgi:hypothetical protein
MNRVYVRSIPKLSHRTRLLLPTQESAFPSFPLCYTWPNGPPRHGMALALSGTAALPCHAVLCHRAPVAAQARHYMTLAVSCRAVTGHRAVVLCCRRGRAPSCAPPPRMRCHRRAPPQGHAPATRTCLRCRCGDTRSCS